MNIRVLPSYSIAPASAVVKLVPDVKSSGGIVVVPAGRITGPLRPVVPSRVIATLCAFYKGVVGLRRVVDGAS